MYLWQKLSSKKWEDAWEDRFCGNPNAVIEEFRNKKRIRLSVYCQSSEEAANLQTQFGGSVRQLKQENWVAMAAVERKPLKIRDRLVVVGEGEGPALDARRVEFAGRIVLSFPPEMAFGTGDHETTSTVLRYLVDEARERREEKWDCLDLGCGTGILGIAAHHLGASSVYGFDFDPQAVKVAQEAAIRNESSAVVFELNDVLKWENDARYDLVVANLFATILRDAFPRIRQWIKADGTLLISGILAEQWDDTQSAAEAVGFEIIDWIRKGKWVTAKGRLEAGA